MRKQCEYIINILFLSCFLLPILINGCSFNSPTNPSVCFDKIPSTLAIDITVEEAHDLIEDYKYDSNFVILDVRTPQEFEAEYIENAVNIDYYSKNFQERLQDLDSLNIYLVYCKSGGRSSSATEMMTDLGFEKVYNMLGGITEWKGSGYETNGCPCDSLR